MWELLDDIDTTGLDLDEVENCFSQRERQQKAKPTEKKSVKDGFCALDGKRTQAVGILMGSLKVSSEHTHRDFPSLGCGDAPVSRC